VGARDWENARARCALQVDSEEEVNAPEGIADAVEDASVVDQDGRW
jgi:hypothetical protein